MIYHQGINKYGIERELSFTVSLLGYNLDTVFITVESMRAFYKQTNVWMPDTK